MNGHSSPTTVPLWLDGKPLPVDESNKHPVTSAQTGQVVHHYQSATLKDVDRACRSSDATFKTWKQTPPVSRRELLQRVAALYEQNEEKLVQLQVAETSATEEWARMNVATSALHVREIASQITNAVTGAIPSLRKPNTYGFVFKQPIGPVLVIPPWNAALVLCTRAITSALGAGCTVVLKASELCPATHHQIVQLFTEAGLPPGVINAVQVSRQDASQITEALIADKAIRKVEFIGSAGVGSIVGSIAAKHLKPVTMELGGKCPAIVLDDANIEQAAAMCAKGAVLHHGQICFSTERIIVQRSVADAFKKALSAAISGEDPGTAVTTRIAQHAQEVLADARAHGLEFLLGTAEMSGSNGASLRPAIVLEPRGDARIRDEETFGPSASLYVVDTDAEAIALANDSAYGLNATVHTRDMHRMLQIAGELEYGQVHANSVTPYSEATAPQKGVKNSGWGSTGGKWGIEGMMVEKFVSFQAPPPK